MRVRKGILLEEEKAWKVRKPLESIPSEPGKTRRSPSRTGTRIHPTRGRKREREMWPLGEPPTDKELEVARILCDLEELILGDEFRRSNLSLVADGCGGPRSASPVTPLLFSGGNGDKDEAGPSAVATSGHSRHIVEDDAGSSAALPSLPGNRPEHNDGVATSGQGRHTVVDDVGPSVAPPSVLGNRSEHDDALATSRQETHTVDGDAGSSAPPPSVPRNRSENNDAGPRGAAPLPRGKQFKNPKRWCKEAAAAPAPAPAPDHHINLDLELRLCQPSPPALVRHPTLASVRPPEETSEALRWGWELQLQIQSEDRKEASRLARKRRMEIQREKKMQKKAKRSD
ncbi:uncharacterized protein LOC135598538 isoform X4 [Musa acuminata AAA Group]|uniref:uncharacterized protein LOC135598538 isoform X4 n=1 Tax=Musa acuminata AAA Group TaxID=214697 RepID=UPI0031E10033